MAARDGRPPVISKRTSALTRELGRRLSGSDKVLVLWHPERDRVELSVSDVATGAGSTSRSRRTAMDAFQHPYAYTARHETAYHPGRTGTTLVDD